MQFSAKSIKGCVETLLQTIHAAVVIHAAVLVLYLENIQIECLVSETMIMIMTIHNYRYVYL